MTVHVSNAALCVRTRADPQSLLCDAGAYEPAATLPKSSSTKSLPAESRFQPGIGDYIGHKSTLMAAAKVGPGTYVVESSMLKKSHNVNFRPKT